MKFCCSENNQKVDPLQQPIIASKEIFRKNNWIRQGIKRAYKVALRSAKKNIMVLELVNN